MMTILYLLICWLSSYTINIPILAGTIIWDVSMWGLFLYYVYKFNTKKLNVLESLKEIAKDIGEYK